MKYSLKTQYALILLLGAVQSAVFAGASPTNRWSVAARAGFNIKADFGYAPGSTPVRTTPSGDAYNYDDGYVLTDVSGSAGGLTWYWGYDDSAAQIAPGNEILMSRSTSTGSSGLNEMDASEPFIGAEILYSRQFEATEDYRFGFNFAVSILPLDFTDRSSFAASVTTTTDAYGYTPATTPPTATPGAPYQGTFNGPGFLISAAPSSTSTVVAPGTGTVHRELEGILWGMRLGSYLEFPINEALLLNVAGGISFGILDVDVDWHAIGAVTEKGGGHDSDVLSGMHLGATLLWDVGEEWGMTVGAQFEYLNDWEGNFGGNTARLDFTRTFYATIGLQREF